MKVGSKIEMPKGSWVTVPKGTMIKSPSPEWDGDDPTTWFNIEAELVEDISVCVEDGPQVKIKLVTPANEDGTDV